MFIQSDIFRFVQIKSPTVNEQASDKGGNLFFRCLFSAVWGGEIAGGERGKEKATPILLLAIKKFAKCKVITRGINV